MFERNYSERKKDILKKPVRIISHYFSTNNYHKFTLGIIALVAVFLMQLSASGETGAPANNQQSGDGSSDTSQVADSSTEDNNLPGAGTNSSPDVSVSSNTTSGNVPATPHVSTQVTINGETIPANGDGSLHRTISTPGGTTTIDVTTQNNDNSWNSSSSTNNSFHSSISNNTVVTNTSGGITNQ